MTTLADYAPFDGSTWGEYAGKTVAVRAGHVLAVGESPASVWKQLRETPCPDPEDCDYVVWVPTQALSYTPRFSEWERAARDLHREFNRALRG